MHLAEEECQGRARALPLQWARGAAAHSQRRDLGLQQGVHAVHPALAVRGADVDGHALLLRLGLLQRGHHRTELLAV